MQFYVSNTVYKNGVRAFDIHTSDLGNSLKVNSKLKSRKLKSKKDITRIYVGKNFNEAVIIIN